MRTIPPAPRSTVTPDLARSLRRPDVAEYIAKANREYCHWDDLRRRPLPVGFTDTDACAAVKLSRAFARTLPLLTPDGQPFRFWLPDIVQEAIHLIDRRSGGLLTPGDHAIDDLGGMRERLRVDSLEEEAIATSQIEGAVTTRRVAREMLRTGRPARNESEQMIVNGHSTMVMLKERIREPLTIDLVHEIRSSMTRLTLGNPADAGRLRNQADRVAVVDTRDNEVIFTPPPAAQLPERLERLIEFANADPRGTPFIHPLVRGSILHFWLAYEHPYVDGNGRTARALFYWYMLKQGYWLFEFLTISRVIYKSRMQYYRAFRFSEIDDQDLTYFLVYHLRATRAALEELHKRLDQVREETVRASRFRLLDRLNPRQLALAVHSLDHPDQVYTIESHRRSHNVSYETARADLLVLAARGILREVGGKKPRRFVPAPDLRRRLASKPPPSGLSDG